MLYNEIEESLTKSLKFNEEDVLESISWNPAQLIDLLYNCITHFKLLLIVFEHLEQFQQRTTNCYITNRILFLLICEG